MSILNNCIFNTILINTLVKIAFHYLHLNSPIHLQLLVFFDYVFLWHAPILSTIFLWYHALYSK